MWYICARYSNFIVWQARREAHEILRKIKPSQMLDYSVENKVVIRKARVTYTTCMIVNAYASISDVSQRTLAVLNAVKWCEEGGIAKMADLPDIVQKKIAALF